MTGSGRLVVVLTADSTLLADWSSGSGVDQIQRVPWIDGERAMPPDLLARQIELMDARACCIASDVPEELALEVASLLDQRIVPVGVLLIRTPSADLWRRGALVGVRDILAPGSTVEEVRRSVSAIIDRSERQRASLSVAAEPTARVLTVLSPKGGSGKTMVATNLAVALAQQGAGDVVLIDLDCVFGDVASVLGMVPERTIGQLAALPSIDSTTVKVFLTRHADSGIQVLAGSGLPEEGEAVTAEVAQMLVDFLSRDFAFVVIDTAAGLDERALAAIDVSTDLIFVASLDVTSIRNLGKEIDALDRMGLSSAARTFILNRADARVGLEVDDVERALGMPATAALPSARSVPLSMNQGRTLVVSDPTSPVAMQIVNLARHFTHGRMSEATNSTADEKRGRLFRRRPS